MKRCLGSLMLITDHINWSGFNPLIGANDDSYGPRFHDMSDGYNKNYRTQLLKVANKIIKNYMKEFIACIQVQTLKHQQR